MSAGTLGPGPRTRVRRLPKKASYDEAVIVAILDEAPLCHVAALVGERPVAIPTLHAREGRTLFLHGSPANATLKSVVAAGEAFVTATLYDGLRLARSGFESSIAYRSVTVVGPAREVTGTSEKARVLALFVDRVLAGRAQEVRGATEDEARRTLVVAVTIDEASAKLSAGPTEDEEADAQLAIWSGTVPARLVFEAPIPDTNGAMASGDVPIPASVRALFET